MHALGMLSAEVGGQYRDDVKVLYDRCPSEDLKEQMRTDPVLGRFLED